MSETIERVAKAILHDIGNGVRLNHSDPYNRIMTIQLSSADFIGMSRAAIRAMREPSAQMTRCAADIMADADHKSEYGYAIAIDDVVHLWQAMIDEALK